MSRVSVIVCAVFPLLASGMLHAEETDESQVAALSAARPELAMVTGLATDDLLNIRSNASPVEKVVGRLANGATVRKNECRTVKGYEWCRVDAIEKEGVSGWAPARYLQTIEIEEGPTGTVAPAEPEDAIEGASAATPEPGKSGDEPAAAPEPARAAAAATAPGSGETADGTADAPAPAAETEHEAAAPLPPGLEARFAGAPAAAADEPPAAREQAVAMAFAPVPAPEGEKAADAKADKPAQGVVVSLPFGLEERFGAPRPALPETDVSRTAFLPAEPLFLPEADAAAGVAEAAPAADGASMPVPTPRPHAEGDAEGGVSGTAVAAVPPERQSPPAAPAAAAASEAAGEIPCARYVGQPMVRCEARVARIGDGDADVTVAWPDGGTRVIRFRNGAPEGSNARGEFRFTREGSLNMIRIGVSERFEIVDELSFGG